MRADRKVLASLPSDIMLTLRESPAPEGRCPPVPREVCPHPKGGVHPKGVRAGTHHGCGGRTGNVKHEENLCRNFGSRLLIGQSNEPNLHRCEILWKFWKNEFI
jgi:hypothetical protein